MLAGLLPVRSFDCVPIHELIYDQGSLSKALITFSRPHIPRIARDRRLFALVVDELRDLDTNISTALLSFLTWISYYTNILFNSSDLDERQTKIIHLLQPHSVQDLL